MNYFEKIPIFIKLINESNEFIRRSVVWYIVLNTLYVYYLVIQLNWFCIRKRGKKRNFKWFESEWRIIPRKVLLVLYGTSNLRKLIFWTKILLIHSAENRRRWCCCWDMQTSNWHVSFFYFYSFISDPLLELYPHQFRYVMCPSPPTRLGLNVTVLHSLRKKQTIQILSLVSFRLRLQRNIILHSL